MENLSLSYAKILTPFKYFGTWLILANVLWHYNRIQVNKAIIRIFFNKLWPNISYSRDFHIRPVEAYPISFQTNSIKTSQRRLCLAFSEGNENSRNMVYAKISGKTPTGFSFSLIYCVYVWKIGLSGQVLSELRDRVQVSTARASWKHLSADGIQCLSQAVPSPSDKYLWVTSSPSKNSEPIISWYYLFN